MGIIVLDFGGQYAHLIANRIRRLRVFAEIRSPTTVVSELADADGFILSGGPSSVYDEEAPSYNREIFAMGKPMLGLCYGHQLLCHRLGGQVEPGSLADEGPRNPGVGQGGLERAATCQGDHLDLEFVWRQATGECHKLFLGTRTVECRDQQCDGNGLVAGHGRMTWRCRSVAGSILEERFGGSLGLLPIWL